MKIACLLPFFSVVLADSDTPSPPFNAALRYMADADPILNWHYSIDSPVENFTLTWYDSGKSVFNETIQATSMDDPCVNGICERELTKAMPDTEYHASLSACTQEKCSGPSVPFQITTRPAVPGAVYNFRATKVDNRIRLSWNEPAYTGKNGPIEHYLISVYDEDNQRLWDKPVTVASAIPYDKSGLTLNDSIDQSEIYSGFFGKDFRLTVAAVNQLANGLSLVGPADPTIVSPGVMSPLKLILILMGSLLLAGTVSYFTGTKLHSCIKRNRNRLTHIHAAASNTNDPERIEWDLLDRQQQQSSHSGSPRNFAFRWYNRIRDSITSSHSSTNSSQSAQSQPTQTCPKMIGRMTLTKMTNGYWAETPNPIALDHENVSFSSAAQSMPEPCGCSSISTISGHQLVTSQSLPSLPLASTSTA